MCGVTTTCGMPRSGWSGPGRLTFDDIEAGPEEVTVANLFREGGLVDQAAAADVDHDAARGHAAESLAAEDVPRLGFVRDVQGDHVRPAQRRIELIQAADP